jgi:hypothetical protein
MRRDVRPKRRALGSRPNGESVEAAGEASEDAPADGRRCRIGRCKTRAERPAQVGLGPIGTVRGTGKLPRRVTGRKDRKKARRRPAVAPTERRRERCGAFVAHARGHLEDGAPACLEEYERFLEAAYAPVLAGCAAELAPKRSQQRALARPGVAGQRIHGTGSKRWASIHVSARSSVVEGRWTAGARSAPASRSRRRK